MSSVNSETAASLKSANHGEQLIILQFLSFLPSESSTGVSSFMLIPTASMILAWVF